MTIKMMKREGGVTLFLQGRLDTSSAQSAQEAFMKILKEYSDIILDFKEVAYVSSAGLRSLLALQKGVNQQRGALKLVQVKKEIIEVFEMTGFSNILNAES